VLLNLRPATSTHSLPSEFRAVAATWAKATCSRPQPSAPRLGDMAGRLSASDTTARAMATTEDRSAVSTVTTLMICSAVCALTTLKIFDGGCYGTIDSSAVQVAIERHSRTLPPAVDPLRPHCRAKLLVFCRWGW
jgi:hypothetical protein